MLLVLATHANKHGLVAGRWAPSYGVLAEQSRYTIGAVKKALEALRGVPVIRQVGGSRGRRIEWEILMPREATRAPRGQLRLDDDRPAEVATPVAMSRVESDYRRSHSSGLKVVTGVATGVGVEVTAGLLLPPSPPAAPGGVSTGPKSRRRGSSRALGTNPRARAAAAIVEAEQRPCVLVGLEASEREELAASWEPVRADLRTAVGKGTWHLWLAEVHLHRVESDELVLGAPAAKVEWTRARFNGLLTAAARSNSLLTAAAAVRIEACFGSPAVGGRR